MNQSDLNQIDGSGYSRNLCISALPESVSAQVLVKSTRFSLKQEMLLSSSSTTDCIYFLEEGLASIIKRDRSGSVLESGMVGREGLIGGYRLFGIPAIQGEVRVIVEGVARKIGLAVLKDIIDQGSLERAHTHFMYALHEQTSQNVLCNRHHELESRLARWLLQVSDFTQSRTLLFKHSLLAELLGVTRSAVTIAAGRLLDDGLIRYSRGEIVILQRAQLRDAACECYKTLYKVYKTIYPTLF
jgi:CRP-like cAMP-binding protein